jgi:single-stranded-DNA-specific exonuclease
MLRNWLEPRDTSVPGSYYQAIGGNPLVSEVLYARGITTIDRARGFLSSLDYPATSATQIPNMERAVDLIHETISRGKTIGVWGDFDVDGQTSTTVLVSALRDLGAHVTYHIPVRAEESHGISLPVLEDFIRSGVDLLLTCDTGITAHEAIDFAQQNSVSVIITDHHDLPEVLPSASVIINPKMLPASHPLSTLPGVGVAFKLAEQLFHGTPGENSVEQYLDLVALGIVADIALLQGDTRYLLQRGLEVLRHTSRPGLLAIMELAELNQANLTEEHISFILAPRMNAIGRLEDANSMVELLTTRDMGRARLLALDLERTNAQRKMLTDQVYQAAQAQVSADPGLLEFPVLVLSHPTWPAGVIGVVASRLVEQYHRPVILFSAPEGVDARGSARSIETVNITSAIAANQQLVNGFGGHPMAAGLSIDPSKIPAFRRAISRTIQELGVGLQAEKDLHIDAYLALTDLSIDLVEDLERLAPFGAGNPPPVFATRNVRLTGYAAVGRSSDHLLLTIEDVMGHTQRCIWWQGAGYSLPEAKFDLAYSVRASTYKGQREVQVEWIDYREISSESVSLSARAAAPEVADFRQEPKPLQKLIELQKSTQLLVWGEAQPNPSPPCLDRLALQPSPNLAIWSIPPGPDELGSALQKVQPAQIYLFANNPGMDEPGPFLRRLVGLLKNRLKNTAGIASLSDLASATAQRQVAVIAGLEWLDAHGHIQLVSLQQDEVKISLAGTKKKDLAAASSSRLKAILAESAAFRRYYLTADKDRLVITGEQS